MKNYRNIPSSIVGILFVFATVVASLVSSTTYGLTCAAGTVIGSNCVVFLTSGTSWTVPADWNNASNTIEVIGGGGGGGASTASNSGAGGGGGGYSKIINASLSGNVTYAVGSGGASGVAGGNTYFCNSTSNCASISGTAVIVGATGGGFGSQASNKGLGGGGGPISVASTTYSGGNGGTTAGGGGAGGGGAAGPNGAGVVGSNDNSGTNAAGGGGAGDNGSGGAGGSAGSGGVGGTGGNGTEYDSSYGSGGGGGGGTFIDPGPGGAGGPGGSYGGGGGGGGMRTPAAGGAGAQGIIVITYTPPAFYHSSITLTGNVKFLGNLVIVGALSKGSGTFMIDHPLYPRNYLLLHSFVESPDAKNVYNGTVMLDGNGEATVQLPDYFDALNGSVRYQYFPLDRAMPNLHIKTEEKDNQFTIGGGAPGGRVSWQITGIRHDPYILAHPIIVEVWKGPGQPVKKGECLYEPLCK